MIGWNFPSNNFGLETGYYDAGIETFRGNPLESLAREINQNSLDAKHPKEKRAVEVHFELLSLPKENFPSKDSFIDVLESCRQYWSTNKKVQSFIKEAKSLMNSHEMLVLKISDYYTTGLLGSDQDHGTDWHNLIKSAGTSDKKSGAGGSYGIGKNAPFVCSNIRTVFYSTKDMYGKTAFQGVAKLFTHKNDYYETTQGTGYFGVVKQNKPINNFKNVGDFFIREQIGTDIFVMGFNKEKNWQDIIVKSVLENFFMAIHEENLIVKVGNVLMNSSNLSDLLEYYTKDDENCLSEKYYSAYISPESQYFFEEDFEGLGRVELFVLKGTNFPKKVSMIRQIGMKIYDKGHFHTPMKFAGVLLVKGEKFNEFLREVEPPSHNNWNFLLHSDRDRAKTVLKKLNSWINNKVKSIAYSEESEELDVEGISQYLPDDLDETSFLDEEKSSEGDIGHPKAVDIKSRYQPPVTSSNTTGEEATAAPESDIGTMFDDGHIPNKETGGQPSQRDGGASEGDEKNASKPGDDESTSKKSAPIRLKNVRMFCADPSRGIYQVSLEPDMASDHQGYLFFKIVGEVGDEPAPISSAKFKETGKELNVAAGNKVGPLNLLSGKRQHLVITLNDSIRCALEVSASAGEI